MLLALAQVHASAATLRLVTFDADGTLYADGAHMEQDNRMIGHIVDLMRANIHVAIVTAAGCVPAAPLLLLSLLLTQQISNHPAQLRLANHVDHSRHVFTAERCMSANGACHCSHHITTW